jgi:hypothetical protein
MSTSNQIHPNQNLQVKDTTPQKTSNGKDRAIRTALDEGLKSEALVQETPLSKRTAQVLKNSKSLGFVGWFRAIFDYIFNSSTKSWDQARINVAAKDYLKVNPKEAEQISQEVPEDILRVDTRVAQAFVGALKECRPDSFKTFCSGVIKQIDFLIERGSKEPDGVSQDEIKNAATLVGKLALVLPAGQNFSPSALALHALVQKFPDNGITPNLIVLCKNFPEEALALAKGQDFQMTQFTATNDKDGGLLLMYNARSYKPEILDLITPNLFEEGPDRDAAIGKLLASKEFQSNLVCGDGIQRQDIPHITLPNGVKILSNRGESNSEYCEEMGKPYDQAKYLKYMLDKFKAAYGTTDEAIKAFKVFVQNFTGSGNTLEAIATKIYNNMPENSQLMMRAMNLLGAFRGQENYVHATQMDKDFGIRLNIIVCASKEGEIETLNQRTISGPRLSKGDMFAITISSYIPAARNATMDQRGQRGAQTTHFTMMHSFQPNAQLTP